MGVNKLLPPGYLRAQVLEPPAFEDPVIDHTGDHHPGYKPIGG